MRPPVSLKHQFVESAPDRLDEGILYVSIRYRTVMHRCCCGCGNEVVTTLSPTDWQLTFDGVSISLDPSVGNWSLPCKSHYWIERNRAHWAGQWSDEQIAKGRANDRLRKDRYYSTDKPLSDVQPAVKQHARSAMQRIDRLWSLLVWIWPRK